MIWRAKMNDINAFMKLPGLSDARGECEKQIRQWLSDIQDIDHFDHLNKIVQACDELWKHPRHDHYTTHGLLHSGRIIARLADWLAANRPDALQPMETFLLIGAAYLHDVGRQCVSPEFWKECGIVTEDISDEERNKQVTHKSHDLLENVRATHPSLSERMIKDACKDTVRVSSELL